MRPHWSCARRTTHSLPPVPSPAGSGTSRAGFRLVDVDEGFLLLTGAVRSELHRHLAARRLLQLARYLQHARSDACTDVERSRVEAPLVGHCRRRRYPHGSRNISNVDVVARLEAIPKNGERAVIENPPAEDRDYARFTMRVLSRSVHVAEAQRHRVEPVNAAIIREIELDAQLGDGVG